MTDIEQKAFDNFVASAHDWNDEQVEFLHGALNNYITHKLSPHVAAHIEAHPHEPLQVVRDRRIVDYLFAEKDMELNDAVSLWSEWEDHEFELRQPNPVNA